MRTVQWLQIKGVGYICFRAAPLSLLTSWTAPGQFPVVCGSPTFSHTCSWGKALIFVLRGAWQLSMSLAAHVTSRISWISVLGSCNGSSVFSNNGWGDRYNGGEFWIRLNAQRLRTVWSTLVRVWKFLPDAMILRLPWTWWVYVFTEMPQNSCTHPPFKIEMSNLGSKVYISTPIRGGHGAKNRTASE